MRESKILFNKDHTIPSACLFGRSIAPSQYETGIRKSSFISLLETLKIDRIIKIVLKLNKNNMKILS